MRTLDDVSPLPHRGPDAAAAERAGEALRAAGVVGPPLDLGTGLASASPFLADLLVAEAGWLALVSDPRTAIDVIVKETDALADAPDAEAMAGLRALRRRAALLVAFADRGGLWSLEETTDALADVADAGIRAAWALGVAHSARRRRLPPDMDPAQGGFVLALGKLGSRSLNYSSDVDLVCFHDPTRADAPSAIDLTTGFSDAAKRLGHVLCAPPRHAHRVDWRLRPDPGATPLSIATGAALNYYQTQGRSWERLAYITARPVAGDLEAACAFLAALEPFVWRRTLDYSVARETAETARRMRETYGQDDVPSDLTGWNAKTGPGGIREIEFAARVRQTIRGGREPALRAAPTLEALRALDTHGLIEGADDLAAAYHHLRAFEHCLQMVADRQTQVMPPPGPERERVAALMRTGPLVEGIERHRKVVSAVFGSLLPAPVPDTAAARAWRSLDAPDGAERAAPALAALGLEGAAATRVLGGWMAGRPVALRSPPAREAMDRAAPLLIAAAAETTDPDATLRAIDRIVARVSPATQLPAMLAARPALAAMLARIAGGAPGLADRLTRDPALLAEATQPDFWGPPAREAVATRIRAVERGAGDFETAMDAVRLVDRAETFRIGARLLEGLGPYDAGRDLTAVTEAGLARLWNASLDARGVPADADLAVIAMGRMGARELTLASDLDLVILAASHETAQRDARLARSFVTAVTAPTAEGTFRALDMRLRPSGRAGPLVTALTGFRRHHETAEAWELVALGRARVLPLGRPDFEAEVEGAIRDTLLAERDGALADDARAMLARVHAERPPSGPDDVKLRPGGLFAIEFAAHATKALARDPALAAETRTPSLLTALADRAPDPEPWRTLAEAHEELSAALHRRSVTAGDAPASTDDPLARSQRAVAGVMLAL